MAYDKNQQHDTSAVLFYKGKTMMAGWASANDALIDLVEHYKLLVFDFDRTIVPFNSDKVYDEWDGFIDELKIDNLGTKVAILTNQGGIVFREKTGDKKYPTIAQALQRLSTGSISMGIGLSKIYISWGIEYDGQWAIPKGMTLGDDGSTPEERKPNGALLRRIMEDFEVESSDTLMIGDSLTDIGAAKAVGCDGLLVKMERYGTKT